MIQKAPTVKWKPFSDKHKQYIKHALQNRMCVAEGAIRSGKTIDHCIIAAMYLEQCPDRFHLASGSTIPNAKMNIGDCNGFGIEHLFRGRCRWGKYKDNEALYLHTQTGEKILIFAGGGKSDSYRKILGNSYGLWIATEINEHFDSDDSRSSFIKVANGRQAAAEWPFTLWDMNPCHPSHQIYADYIDKYTEGFLGGYLYGHFTMADNLSVTKERRAQIESQYIPGTVWHDRDILGKRKAAEGLIYQQFADNKKDYLITPSRKTLSDVLFVSIGVDFGGSRSLTTFVASAIHVGFQKVTIIADHHIQARKGEIDADRLCREFVGFVQRLRTDYPWLYIRYCWADSEAQYLINSLRMATTQFALGFDISDCKKLKIKNRIFAATTLLNTKRMTVAECCTLVQGGLENAIWNPKKPDERLDNFSTDIDIMDAFEYSWEAFIKKLCPYLKER